MHQFAVTPVKFIVCRLKVKNFKCNFIELFFVLYIKYAGRQRGHTFDLTKILLNFISMLSRKKSLFCGIILTGILVYVSSCIKKETYPAQPKISYKEFQNFQADSGYFTFKFTDGDGDFGLKAEDTSGTFTSSSKYYYNLYIKYLYKKADGTWSAYFNANPLVNDTQYYKFRVPFIEQTGKDKSMNGEVRVKLTELRPTASHKNIKYLFYIFDKSLNQSNVEESPEFALP